MGKMARLIMMCSVFQRICYIVRDFLRSCMACLYSDFCKMYAPRASQSNTLFISTLCVNSKISRMIKGKKADPSDCGIIDRPTWDMPPHRTGHSEFRDALSDLRRASESPPCLSHDALIESLTVRYVDILENLKRVQGHA